MSGGRLALNRLDVRCDRRGRWTGWPERGVDAWTLSTPRARLRSRRAAHSAIAGFEECYGRSIFHCPYCDGWGWRDRRLAAFGRGQAVARLALGLKTWSADVVACTHGAAMEGRLRERLARNGIAVRTDTIAA